MDAWRTYCRRLRILCRGDEVAIAGWLQETPAGWNWFCGVVVLIASAMYGASLGCWQALLQAAYAAAKFPLLIFATVFGNALLNGMLAQVFGLPVTMRQSLLVILMSFVMATLLLAAFAPVALFLAYSVPATDKGYSVVLLTHVAVIAYAGIAANVRLLRLLRLLSGCRQRARRILLAWLAGNLLVGTQISWIISPFIGDPAKPVMLLQEHPFQRNFFEYAGERARRLCSTTNPKETK